MWYWGWRSAQLVNSPVSLWVQVWHQPREYYPVWTEHRDRSHCRPGIALRVRRRGSALSSNVRHESGLPRHKENLLLRRFPQVSLSTSCIYKPWMPLWFWLETRLWWDVIFTHTRFSAVQLLPTDTWVCLHPVQMTSLSFCCNILLQRFYFWIL